MSSHCPPGIFFGWQVKGTILKLFYFHTFFEGPLLHAFKLGGGRHSRLYSGTAGYMVVAHKILVSAPVPLELIGPLTGLDWVGAVPRGFGDKGFKDLGLTIVLLKYYSFSFLCICRRRILF